MEFEKLQNNETRSVPLRHNDSPKMTNTDLLDRDVFGYAIDKGWMCQVFS